MKLIRINIVLVFSFLITSWSNAQSAKEILKEVNQTYFDKAYKLDYTISGFLQDEKVYGYKGHVAVDESQRLSSNDSQITICNENYFFHMDNESQTIVVNEITQTEKAEINRIDLMKTLDSIVTASNPELISTTESEFQILLDQKNDPFYSRIYLKISKDFKLTGVIYFTRDEESGLSRIEVTYENIEIVNHLNSDLFSIDSYIIVTKNKIVAKEDYKAYRIIDQREL